MPQIVTATFFRFKTGSSQFWALSMMQFAHKDLKRLQGCSFYKLMGSGRGSGFNAFPDYSTYLLFQVWESAETAHSFFETTDFFQSFRKRAKEVWTVYLTCISSHGQWNGSNPFRVEKPLRSTEVIVALTRATIKWHKLLSFWRYVPTSHKSLNANKGLIFAKGVGEIPVVQMATLSIWKDIESLNGFAYNSKQHKEAIHKTRKLNWYKEELFARFNPYKSVGTWHGKNPIPNLV